MSTITRFSVAEIAADIGEPFSMAKVATVDDILVSVTICQGELERHKHVDVDELFWVYQGEMSIESERGVVHLDSGELAVVPKGTEHRSRSADRAVVMVLRCGFMPNRKNGKRRLYAVGDSGLSSLNLQDKADELPAPFRFRSITRVEDSMIQVARGSGRWPVELPVVHDRMFYVVDGALTVRTVRGRVRLRPGDLTVVPRGAFYHLHTAENTHLVRMTRGAL